MNRNMYKFFITTFAITLTVVLSLTSNSVALGIYENSDDVESMTQNISLERKKHIINYFVKEEISDAQEKAFKITNKYAKKRYNKELHFSMLSAISSKRGFGVPNSKTTTVEKILDNAVDYDDLPIESFSLDEIKMVKNDYKQDPNIHPEYEICSGDNVINLHQTADSGAIVQVASQYNALESVCNQFSPVKYWFLDKTQGPLACLQAVAATKHRESAALKQKLPDAMKDLLDGCTVNVSDLVNSDKEKIKITEKYPDLYQNGYLEATVVGEQSLSDLKELSEYIKKNKGRLGFNSQWVRCEGSQKKQLHVFNAAPSFQCVWGQLNWDDSTDPRVLLYSEICKDLVVEQYRTIARVAAIKSAESGRQEELHLYQVGQGAFYNTLETMPEALKAVKNELEGFNVKVYLHEGYGGRARPWKVIVNNL